MNDSLTISEQNKYIEMWNIPQYRNYSPGMTMVDHFFNFFDPWICKNDSITDFGCGTGHVVPLFLEKNLTVQLVDIAPNALSEEVSTLTILIPDKISFHVACIWDLSEEIMTTDWIYCMDVLEHIPTEKIEATLQNIAKRMKKGGTLQVVLDQDDFGQLIGKPLHLTVKPLGWWNEIISQFFEIKCTETILENLIYIFHVLPKKT